MRIRNISWVELESGLTRFLGFALDYEKEFISCFCPHADHIHKLSISQYGVSVMWVIDDYVVSGEDIELADFHNWYFHTKDRILGVGVI